MFKYPKSICLLLIILAGCKKPYNPPAITNNANYLVVEGVINTGADSTVIKLSRTVQLAAKTTVNAELHAKVIVVSSTNVVYPLTETGRGYYGSAGLNLSAANTYSLKIIAANGKVYQSDFLQVKNSPPIDSVNYVVEPKAVRINVNTHDPLKQTTYYRWDFTETYMIHARYQSEDKLITTPVDTVVPRTAQDQVYTCWATDTASTILLGSTARLSKDLVSQMPLTEIPFTSEKIADRYSILVRQYALTPDAYLYWTQLKTNTEQLGSIFDALPSELPGNIHCVSNPLEPVIGYIGVGAVSQVRIYVDSRNLPPLNTIVPLSIDGCIVQDYLFKDIVGNSTLNDVYTWIYSGKQFVISADGSPGNTAGYQATDRFCADCTLRGSNVQPAFWTY